MLISAPDRSVAFNICVGSECQARTLLAYRVSLSCLAVRTLRCDRHTRHRKSSDLFPAAGDPVWISDSLRSVSTLGVYS